MHGCTKPFFHTRGNPEMAKKYGIYIGSSHCEPMLRNTNAEWNRKLQGEYNFLTNRNKILDFWEERIIEGNNMNAIYTLGLRGEHDSQMVGVKGLDNQHRVMNEVISKQRRLIADFCSRNVEKIPQVFIPYKEVLDIYKKGLDLPEDVTLMWCDDNYGYIRYLPDSLERKRSGGSGIYYHVSYRSEERRVGKEC